jgi:type II secretory pathway component PulF
MYTAYNVVIRDRLVQSYNLMQRGTSFAEAFQATGLFHNSIEQLIVTGQQSGQLVEMLDQAADYYQELVEESSRKAKFAMLRFGILAMLILGGATLLWLVRSYFAALFHFADNFETLPGFIFPSGR